MFFTIVPMRRPALDLQDPGNIYGRLTNSTGCSGKACCCLRRRHCCLALASGAAAIAYTLQALGQNGGHIVAQKTIYGGSYNLLAHTLPGFGITASFVNIHDLDEVEAAIEENTRAIYIETLGNPNSDIPNIDALAALAHRHGLPLVVDNTFGTPYFIRPIEHGADIVVHSATKFLGGHGTTLGGIIVDSEANFDWTASGKYGPPLPKQIKLSWRFFCEGRRTSSLCYLYPCNSASRYRSNHFSVCRVFIVTGNRNIVAARGTSCEKYEEGGRILRWSSTS